MKKAPFEGALVRKSERALKVARLALNAGDNDSAVSRSYYAMFDIARAALLRSGVAEDKLPRTHSGVTEAFRNHAVQSGRLDRELGAELSRIESLRIKADYTGTEIEPEEAAEVVRKAEFFVQSVERAYGLGAASMGIEYRNDAPNDDDKVSEPALAVSKIQRKEAQLEPNSLEEVRRQARENWARLRQQTIEKERKVGLQQGSGHDAKEDQGHSQDPDLSE